MTFEEAIEVQKWLGNNHFLFAKTFEDVKASTDMAIKSLEAWEKVREIFKAKSISDDWEYIHDLQIWEDALEIIDKHLKAVEE